MMLAFPAASSCDNSLTPAFFHLVDVCRCIYLCIAIEGCEAAFGRLPRFQDMKTNIYVDGFTLYHGSLKKTPFRWLDIPAMCRLLLPSDQIDKIRSFIALVHPRPHDPDQLTGQKTYVRALRTIPNLAIIEGSFLAHEVIMPLAPVPRQISVQL